nr:ABC transporter permease [Bacteroidota bacterium]
MLRNFIIVAFRNIIRNKFLSIINVLGLATGIASCLAIFLYVRYESNYDRFHHDYERIYRILSHQPNNSFMGTNMFCVTPAPLLPLIKNEVPEIETGCRIGTVGGYVSHDDHIFPERGILLTDSSFFDVFSFKSSTHAPEKVLTDPSKILITNTIAEKHFKDEDPIGMVLRLSIYGKNYDVVVSGILSDPPQNSHFSFDYLASFNLVNQIQGDGITTNWDNFNYYTFVKLKKDVEPGTTDSKINKSFMNARGEEDIEVRMQALTDIHLHSHHNFEMSGNNDIRQVYLFSSIAVLILFIACFNYINLTTARAAGRFKEIGVRKVLGANKSVLVKQFIFESIVITIISFLISLILIEIFNPTIKTVLRSDTTVYSNGAFLLLFFTSVVLIVGVLSGSYPAFVLAG